MKNAAILLTLATALVVHGTATAQEPSTAPDNTKVNKRDRKAGAATADKQHNDEGDVKLTANIRKALMDDKGLSTYAHNVKIVSQAGMVTLKGPVRTADEKKTIEAKATEIAGAGKVKNMMTVKPKS